MEQTSSRPFSARSRTEQAYGVFNRLVDLKLMAFQNELARLDL